MTTPMGPSEVRALAVGELFSPDAQPYSIPLYQRNYTWGEEQIHRLIYDVLDEAEDDDSKDYFLGTLVVAPPEVGALPGQPFDVIDGQQRLTTLYILLGKLRSVSSRIRDQVGELQPLTYEARERATRALHGVISRPTDEETGQRRDEDLGILEAGEIIDQLLNEPAMKKRLLDEDVVDYLLRHVFLIRMPINREMDLNIYFEIMNTRGAQLSPVDIVKARLLRHLSDPGDRAVLNHVWTSCADMDHYVVMTATAGDTNWRKEVFGEAWDELPTADFTKLREQLIDRRQDEVTPARNTTQGTASNAMTFGEALNTYSRADGETEQKTADGSERFTSQISFPTLLLHVLAVRSSVESIGADECQPDDQSRQLDDKLLVTRFADVLEPILPAEREEWVRSFTTDLLRIRVLFDRYILKRDATLSSDHESTTDAEPGNWSLCRVTRADERDRNVPRYPSTFSDDESVVGHGSLHQRILLIQSALRITYTSPRAMHWITEVLRHVIASADRNEEVTAGGILETLESYARERVREALESNVDGADTDPNGYPLGFALSRIVFTYLDYLLVEEMNRWDFTFSYRTSLEHFSPRVEDTEHVSDSYHVREKQRLDWLGNLALVTVRANSKFSNYLPSEKANNRGARKQSLKLELMARRAETSWNDDDIKDHHNEMVGLLRKALGVRPSGEALPPTAT